MGDPQLDQLSVKELLDLQAQLHTAIRAAIRARKESKANVTARIDLVPAKRDMASERDAWLAARKKGI